MLDYILLETLESNLHDEQSKIKQAKSIIKKYCTTPENYADPIICKKEHFIGKAYIPEDDVTLYWIDLLDKNYFFDCQNGKT